MRIPGKALLPFVLLAASTALTTEAATDAERIQ